jgi:hypothetical protein
MNIDTLLRETLHSYADHATAKTGLLSAARARARRRRTHQTAAALAAAAAVAAMVLAGPTVVGGLVNGAVAPAAPVTLVPPTYQLPPFPFTPGWVPEHAGEPYLGVWEDVRVLSHDPAPDAPYLAPDRPVIIVDVTRSDPGNPLDAKHGSPETETVVVQGREAVLQTADGNAAVAWEHEPDLWVTVWGEQRIPAADVIRYAQELIEEPIPINPPFTFDLVPGGADPVEVHRNVLSFTPPVADEPEGVVTGRVRVELFRREDGETSDPGEITTEFRVGIGEPITVGDRDGELLGDDTVHVFLDDGLLLEVTASGTLSMSQEDLVRFAAGIYVTPHARPFH